ncbi:MAG TPA: tryptophan 7-halogenase [Gemmatimonadota bacterium]|nr:tryptophan 7-halogenase [Gemmatimonadota bacterium]
MTSIPRRADVIVIGSGPAGNSAASLLAREGLEVVLFEKARLPRNTVGESLIPQFWRFVDLIGATDLIEGEKFLTKAGGIGYWRGTARRVRFSDFGYTRPALHVERDRFDWLLTENSRRHGVQVFEETRVTQIDAGSPEATVHWQGDGESGATRCRYVVDGSGQSAVFAHQQGIRIFDPDIRFTSLWGYYVGGNHLTFGGSVHPFEDRFEHHPVTIQSSFGDWGWIWHIPMRETVSVGVVLPPERLKAFKAEDDTPEAKFQGLVREAPIVGKLMEDAEFVGPMYGIRDYAYLPVQLAVENVYMVGDAAAFVDPINSAGVSFGMYAGFLASWAITRSLHQPERRAEFRESFCQLYGDRLSLFRLLAMPSDAPGYLEAAEKAIRGALNTGESEKRLMLTQAVLTTRSEGILSILDRLGVDMESGTTELAVPV